MEGLRTLVTQKTVLGPTSSLWSSDHHKVISAPGSYLHDICLTTGSNTLTPTSE